MHRTGQTKCNQKSLTMCLYFFCLSLCSSYPTSRSLYTSTEYLKLMKRELGLSAGSVAEGVIAA